MRSQAGFTLIEAIMVMAIISILSVSGAYLMAYLVQNSVFIPNKLNMDMLASEALGIMIDGDNQAKGLRFSMSLATIQDNTVAFTNQDGQAITYRLDTVTNKLYRSIAAGPEKPIPYYLATGINLSGKNNKLFTYYILSEPDGFSETETANPVNVGRIKISLVAKTGTGSYADWQGQSEQSSAIAVKRFQ